MNSTPSEGKYRDPKIQQGGSTSFRAPRITKLHPGMTRNTKMFFQPKKSGNFKFSWICGAISKSGKLAK